MKRSELQTLYDFNAWANQRILAAAAAVSAEQLEAAPTPHPGYGSLRSVLIHTLDTEYGWRMLCQYQQFTPELTEAEYPTVEVIAGRWREEDDATRAYLDTLDDDDLDGVIRLTSSNGATRERVLWHCLYHILNHSAQHRSEAAALLTAYDASPGDMDFLAFVSERSRPTGEG